MNPILRALESQAGIYFPGADIQFQAAGVAHNLTVAQDAQPALITSSNAGIPAFLTQYIDPKLIEVLVAPMKAVDIIGEEVKKGDWTTQTATFSMVESTGEVSAYGDYSTNGIASANTNFENRQSHLYQVITNWGELELERAGLARIDWANRLNISSVNTLNRYQNKTYFFGVAGLLNFGLLNDPTLSAPMAPVPQGTAITWVDKDALGVKADIDTLVTQLIRQNLGLVELDTKFTLAMSPVSEAAGLTKTNNFNVNVTDLLKKNYPNMTVKTAPEYSTEAGEFVQLIADEIEGQRTVSAAFTEKMRAHPVKIELSSFQQKKTQGTWGTIIYRPNLIVSMLGV